MQTWSLLERTVKHIVSFMSEQRKTTSHQVVKDILNLLEEEMDQEITPHTVADRLYVNSSTSAGCSSRKWGCLRPMCWNAKWRPSRRRKDLRYDAARLVGYRDVSYFTKVFRKYWGESGSLRDD